MPFTIREFHFVSFTIGQNFYHCANLPTPEIVLRQINGECNYFE